MKNSFENIKLMLYYFSVITLISTVVAACYITFFYGTHAPLTVDILWQILIVSFFCSLCQFIYRNFPDKAGKGRFLMQNIFGYLYINAVVMGFGWWFEWFDTSNFFMVIGMVLVILIAYVVIAAYVFWADFRTSEQINRKLRERNGE